MEKYVEREDIELVKESQSEKVEAVVNRLKEL